MYLYIARAKILNWDIYVLRYPSLAKLTTVALANICKVTNFTTSVHWKSNSFVTSVFRHRTLTGQTNRSFIGFFRNSFKHAETNSHYNES